MVKISEGLDAVKAKAISFVRREMENAQLITEDVYFKKSKGASQSQYCMLTNENFQDLTRWRWDLISKRDMDSWTAEGLSVLDFF